MSDDVDFYLGLDVVDRHAYRSAAIYHKNTGQVFEGPMHVMAHDAAAQAGHPDAHNPFMWDDGFMTEGGEFHDRDRATAEVREAKPERDYTRGETLSLANAGMLTPGAKANLESAIDSHPGLKGAQKRLVEMDERAEARKRGERIAREESFGPWIDDPDRHFYDYLDEVDRHVDSMFRSAAIKHTKTGQVFEGTWHEAARQVASDAGHGDDPWHNPAEYEDGFVTQGGEFVNRDQANKLSQTYPESTTLMVKGHLPLDESVAESGRLGDRFKKKLKEHLERKGIKYSDDEFFGVLGELDRYSDGMFRSAAIIRTKDGKIYEGTWHGAARDAAEAAGDWIPEAWDDWGDGFMTHEGKFVTRDQANEMTQEKMGPRGTNPESINLMTKGLLPVDKSLVNNADVKKSLREDLKWHLLEPGNTSHTATTEYGKRSSAVP
jgi:hypothetical protein